VSLESVPGTYVATYPFGDATLVLQSGGSFTQQVKIQNEVPISVQGSWEFDAARSILRLHGVIPVSDEFDHLGSDWRRTDDFHGIPVEGMWFRVNIELSEGHPYVKQ
jgi:hypothetical protein